ncbi:MAG: PEP-CTERM sorting domain-containing protein [Phycisphaerae bacterium]|nr:PEP-CTERM sorting domain-containing protein [Phycisphaerae bacterium]
MMRLGVKGWTLYAVLGVLASGRLGSAAPFVWQAPSNTANGFELSKNWTSKAASALPADDLTSDVAEFPIKTGRENPSLVKDRNVCGLNFTKGGWKLTGPAYTLSVGGYGIDMSADSGTVTIETNVNVATASDWSLGGTSTLKVTGLLGGSSNFSKSGTGTLALAGANGTYTGILTLKEGTLYLDGNDALGDGAVVALAGGTLNLNSKSMSSKLAGSGTVSGGGTLAGTISPGGSTGVMTFTGLPVLRGVYEWELDSLLDSDSAGTPGTTWDLLTAGGSGTSLTLDSPALTFKAGSLGPDANPFWNDPHDWTIINTSGGGTISGNLGTLPTSTEGVFSSALVATSSLVLHWEPAATHAPEPATLALVAIGGLAVIGGATRKRGRSISPPAHAGQTDRTDHLPLRESSL